MCLLGAALVGMMGCQTSQPIVKPTLHEEYVLPPADDLRFSSPPNYPKSEADNPAKQREKQKQDGQMGMPGGRFGAGPGMGGGY
jgi:hypothetical protein